MVRNTKAKINRTRKNYGVDLSGEIQLPKLEDIKTREQFNEFKNKAHSFTSVSNQKYQFRKNEYGVVASKKEINEIKRNTKLAQEKAKQQIREAAKKPYFVNGKEETTVGQRMKQMANPSEVSGFSVPNDFDFDKIRDRKQLEKKKESMEKRATGEFYDEAKKTLKENIIKAIEKNFNTDGDDLIHLIEGIPADDLYELFLQFDSFQIDYIYTADDEDRISVIDRIENDIDRYYSGDVNMDLKGF